MLAVAVGTRRVVARGKDSGSPSLWALGPTTESRVQGFQAPGVPVKPFAKMANGPLFMVLTFQP